MRVASTDPGTVSETAFIGGQVPQDLYDAFKALADRNDRTVAAELRVAMRAWIERGNGERGAA